MFDTFAMVDWSGGNDTGPEERKDAKGVRPDGVYQPPKASSRKRLLS